MKQASAAGLRHEVMQYLQNSVPTHHHVVTDDSPVTSHLISHIMYYRYLMKYHSCIILAYKVLLRGCSTECWCWS